MGGVGRARCGGSGCGVQQELKAESRRREQAGKRAARPRSRPPRLPSTPPARERPLGLLGVWGSIIEAWLHELLPADAAARAEGGLGVVVTEMPAFKQARAARRRAWLCGLNFVAAFGGARWHAPLPHPPCPSPFPSSHSSGWRRLLTRLTWSTCAWPPPMCPSCWTSSSRAPAAARPAWTAASRTLSRAAPRTGCGARAARRVFGRRRGEIARAAVCASPAWRPLPRLQRLPLTPLRPPPPSPSRPLPTIQWGGGCVLFDYFDDPNIVRNGRFDMLKLKVRAEGNAAEGGKAGQGTFAHVSRTPSRPALTHPRSPHHPRSTLRLSASC